MQVYTLQGFDQKYTIFQHNSMIIEQIQKSREGGRGGVVTYLSHAKKLTMQVNFSGLLSTFSCHSNFQYLSFLVEKKPCFSDDPF